MKLQTQWNLKQKSGDYTSHKKSLSEWLDTSQQALKKSLAGTSDNDEETQKKLSSIMQKIYAGAKLTTKEKQYLKAKNPQAYEKLRSIEQEQKAYEQKLRQCKTKEEVQRLKMTQLASSLATVNSVKNNPHIPLQKKLEICMQEKVRCDRLQASTQKFVQSGEYNRLPTEAEQAKAEKEEKERLEAELKPEDEKTEETSKTEETPKTEASEQPEAADQAEASGSGQPAAATAPPQTKAEPVKTEATSAPAGKTKVTAKPVQAASQSAPSPELRKVRRARRQAARAAYSAAALNTPTPAPSHPALNINA